jgi:UDP-N-acetylglucosamine:LPS N-acetylglucosamine transferase
LQDSHKLKRMSEAARALAHPNAARDIAEMAAKLADGNFVATDSHG